MKSIKDLVREIARREGKKSQVGVGNIREVIGILSDMYLDHSFAMNAILYKNGQRRAKKGKK